MNSWSGRWPRALGSVGIAAVCLALAPADVAARRPADAGMGGEAGQRPRPRQKPCPNGKPTDVLQTYSECQADGFWHVVTDRWFLCPDPSWQLAAGSRQQAVGCRLRVAARFGLEVAHGPGHGQLPTACDDE